MKSGLHVDFIAVFRFECCGIGLPEFRKSILPGLILNMGQRMSGPDQVFNYQG